MYRQYVAAIRETGELKASIEKMEGYLYHYIAVPSARNNTMAILSQETNSIDQIVQTYKGKKLAPEEKKLISDLDTAWIEMQRGYKEAMKMADGGKNDEVSRLLAEGSYLIKARNNTLAAVRNLNDYNVSRNEAAIKANGTGIGGWSGILWLLSVVGAILLIAMMDNDNRIAHQTAEKGSGDDGGIKTGSPFPPACILTGRMKSAS